MLLTCYKQYSIHGNITIRQIGEGAKMIIKMGWLLLALIHATPALAFFRPAMLTKMYRITPDSGLFILMHHRSALFVVVVVTCLWAMFQPEVRQLATVVLGISMASFVALWWQSGAPPALRTIAVTDIVGLVILLFLGWQAFSGGN